MAYGMQVWDASGNSVWDSPSVVGGVPVGVFAGGAGTLSFTEFAGFQMQALTIDGPEWDADNAGSGVSISYGSGYPVVTVQSWAPTFMLAVF